MRDVSNLEFERLGLIVERLEPRRKSSVELHDTAVQDVEVTVYLSVSD